MGLILGESSRELLFESVGSLRPCDAVGVLKLQVPECSCGRHRPPKNANFVQGPRTRASLPPVDSAAVEARPGLVALVALGYDLHRELRVGSSLQGECG